MTNLEEHWLGFARSPGALGPLERAADELIQKVNQAISDGQIQDLSGQLVTSQLDSGLLDIEQRRLYPVREGITILVVRQSISLEKFLGR